MIPDITEVNFPSYMTLHEATVTLNAMGEKTITAQVRIDGDVVPSFVGTDGSDLAVEFKGEKYILPLREPQASKDNESINSLVDLTFYNWAVYQLKRYYFIEMASTNSGTAIADKYVADLALTLPNFCTALQKVLDFYYEGKFTVKYNPNPTVPYDTTPAYVEINYSYIWDVLQNLNEIYDVRWEIKYDSVYDKYTIRFGYDADELTHTFEYGFDGGLLKFERQVQSDSIKNVILGRGGDKNLPKLYFKDYTKYTPESGTWSNGEFTPDPDAIPELVNIYFDALRDSNFRKYVQGWKAQKHYGGASYQPNQGWAYEKGYTDTKFNPVEYVKDDESIAKYGEMWGSLDANEDIYPSIQGVEVNPYGRIDEVIEVSPVTTDDMQAMGDAAATVTNVGGASVSVTVSAHGNVTKDLRGSTFTVPENNVGVLTYSLFVECSDNAVTVDTTHSYVKVYRDSDNVEVPASNIPAGKYYYIATVRINSDSSKAALAAFGIQQVKCSSSNPDAEEWKPTFDIWVKNIWGTNKRSGETDAEYADRVWIPILGDKDGNEAAVVFSDGFLAASSDYEFQIVSYAYDNSKSYNGIISEWKLTLAKSDAELDATGLYIPNAQTGGNAAAGDHFFFIGCDMPYQYVYWAEQKLTAYKEEEGLGENADVNPSWIVSLDKVRVNTPDEELYGAKLIDSIEAGAIVNIRDKRFTNNDTLQLYINTVTYKWQEPSKDAPYIVPDVEITLSDDIIATKTSVETIQSEVNAIKKQYVTADSIQQAVQNVTSRLYLRKSGVSDVSYSPTEFASSVTETEFEEGEVGGSGWGLYKDGDEESVLEADKIIVRKEMHVNQLVVNQITYVGGKQIISAASIECTQVDDTDAGYVCHFNQKRGSVANLFKVGDVAMGQVFNADNLQLKYYKRRVDAIDVDSITLSKTVCQGEGIPAVGDVIIQYGSYTDSDRRFVIVRDVIGGGHEKMLYGLSSVTTDGTEYYFAGRADGESPRIFIGDKELDFIEYKDGKLKIKADIELEAGSDLYNQLNTTSEQVEAQHKIFYDVPTAPYKKGDLWVNAGYPSGTYVDEDGNGIELENGDIPYESLLYDDDTLVCISDNDNEFDLSDWRYSSRYHEDAENIQSVNENFQNYKTATDRTLGEFRDQIDGVVDSWFFGYVPTNENYPASSWTTDDLKQRHVGDTFTNNQTYVDEETTPYAGLSWRWVGVGDYDTETKHYASYQWTKIADSDAVKALKNAAAAQDTADGKRRVFTSQPTVPYDEGDLWVNATYGTTYSNDLLRVKDGKSKKSTESFDIGDWELATDYTNDAAFNSFFTDTYTPFTTSIQGQVDGKAETYYQSADPSSDWDATSKANHVGDLWYNTTADANGYYHTYVYKAETVEGTLTYGWAEINGVPTAVFDSFDGRATIFVAKPATYRTNDMWIIGDDVTTTDMPTGCTVGDIVISLNDRTNAYTKTDWVKKDKYTDDSTFNDFFTNDYSGFKTDIQSQVDGKAETFYQASDPSAAWDNDTKAKHVGDLWYDTTADSNGNTHTYIYKVSGGNYSWVEINGVPKAVFDTIDGKASIFVSKPTTYCANDMWIIESGLSDTDMPTGATAGDIVISSSYRTNAYTKGDWTVKTKYTDDSTFNNFFTNDYSTFKTDIQSQVDGKAETYYQASDPSSSWDATAKAKHVGDLWYDTTADANGNCHTYIYKLVSGTYSWQEINGVPKTVFDTLDGKASIYVTKPTTYNTNDMWIIPSGTSATDMPSGCQVGDIVIALNSRTNAYTKSDWVKKDRYTDDSTFNTFFNDTYSPFVTDIHSQVDGKAETYYQTSDPSSDWDTAAKKATHVGDIWYNTTADANGNTHVYLYKVSSGTYAWAEINGVPTSVFNTIDGKATIFVSKPTTYSTRDLWIIEDGLSDDDMPTGCVSGDIVVSSAGRTNSYTKADWTKKDHYTDDSKIDGILDDIDSDLILSEFEKLSLRTKLKEINPSEEATVIVNDGQVTGSSEIVSSTSFGNWELVESGEYKGYYMSKNHTDNSYSINRFTLTNSNSLKLKVSVVVSGEVYYDYAAIGNLDSSLTYSNSSFVGASKQIKGSSTASRIATGEQEFTFAAGTHTIDVGYRKDSSTSVSPDCVYVKLEFTGCEGTLNDWVQACIKAGVSYTAAVNAANNLFAYMKNVCYVWNNTDTEFESSSYLTSINSLVAAYNAAISGVVQSVPDLQYLKNALGSDIGTTSASGGVTLGTFIGVKDTNANVVAGINATTAIGNDTTNGRLMIFAGSDGVALASDAAFRVYENGHLYASSAEIHGAIYADSGEFNGNIVIGTAGGRRVEIISGDYGTMSMFDSENNVTTHIGNDYCSSINTYISNVTTNSPVILSSNGTSTGTKGLTISQTGTETDEINIEYDQYTGRMFTIQGNPQANKLVGNIGCSSSAYSEDSEGSEMEPLINYVRIQLFACTDTSGSNPISLGYVESSEATGLSGVIAINTVLPAGTYYIFARVNAYAYWDTIYGNAYSTVYIGYSTCSVTALEQKLSIFANGFGYKAASTQYFAIINEGASASSPTGNLAIKMRTNSSSASTTDIGIDCTTSGLRLYGITRTLLGSGNSENTLYSMTDCSSYSFIEVQAVFNSNERVVMFMTRQAWQATSSSYQLQLSTDSSYIKLYHYSNSQFKTGGSYHFTSVAIYGI